LFQHLVEGDAAVLGIEEGGQRKLAFVQGCIGRRKRRGFGFTAA
jgi:hypothetical protein